MIFVSNTSHYLRAITEYFLFSETCIRLACLWVQIMRSFKYIHTRIPEKWKWKQQSYLESGICKRSRNAVHWLNTMLLAPELRRDSSSCRRNDILEDSTQFFSTSIWKRLLVGAVIRSCLLIDFLQVQSNQQKWQYEERSGNALEEQLKSEQYTTYRLDIDLLPDSAN